MTLILDGGAARRMGGVDKALLPLVDGATLMSFLHRRLAAQAEPLAISANGDPDRFAMVGLPVLPDTVGPGWGPLAGVLAGLDRLADSGSGGWLLTVPGDTPLVPPDLAARLGRAAQDGQGTCIRAASGARRHPLVALWSATLREPLRRALRDHALRKVEAFQREHGVAEVAWPTEPYDPFLNVNTPEDLRAVRAVAADLV